MPEKSLAVVLTAPREFEVREFDIPEIGPEDAIMKMEAAGICGSDIGGSLRLDRGPKILGHENIGIIHKIGAIASKRWRVQEGDRVAVEEYIPCGSCDRCRAGEYRFCTQTDISYREGERLWYGSTPIATAPALWGGFSQYMYLHPQCVVHKVTKDVSPEEAALYIAFSNGVEWAYKLGGVKLGDTVVVQGPGQQGLGCVIAAKEAGAERIIVTGLTRDAKRFAIAKKLGATDTVDVLTENFVDKIKDITNGHGADVVVNVSGGGKGTVADAMAVASQDSTIVLPAPGKELMSFEGVGRRNITIKMAHGHSYDSVEKAIYFIGMNKYPLRDLCTHQFGFEGAREAVLAVAGEGAAAGDAIHVSILPPK